MAAAAAFPHAARPGPQLPRAVWASLGAAVLLHAGLLLGQREASFEAGQPAAALRVRMVAAPVGLQEGTPAGVAPVALAAAAAPHGDGLQPMALAILPEAAPAMQEGQPVQAQPALPAQDGLASSEPATAVPAAQAAAADAAADVDDIYLPRSRLSKAPVSSDTPMLFFPPEFAGYGKFTTVIGLFIDEHGAVRRVRVEGQPLPAPLEAVALRTFENLHFAPGQLDGEAVKSFIRIEVTFENRVPEQDRLTLGSS